MKITNLSSTDAVEITDLLGNSSVSQWQDGVRTLIIPASEYRTIPNIQGCNSIAVAALLAASGISVDAGVEPDGTDMVNPTWEIGGPIYGMTATSLS